MEIDLGRAKGSEPAIKPQRPKRKNGVAMDRLCDAINDTRGREVTDRIESMASEPLGRLMVEDRFGRRAVRCWGLEMQGGCWDFAEHEAM